MYFFHLRIKIQKLMYKKKKYSLKSKLYFLIKIVEIVENKEYIILHTKILLVFKIHKNTIMECLRYKNSVEITESNTH